MATCKPWSLTTTVRNPERIPDFLRILSSMAGESFDEKHQELYQIRLIQERLYRPTKLTDSEKRKLDAIEQPLTEEFATELFHSQKYQDPPMRGRQSVAQLNKMGLARARSAEPIAITSAGKFMLEHPSDPSEVFFRHFLKWQLPNPDDTSFTEKAGFNIKPFIGSLHLIRAVNERWKEEGGTVKGLSMGEFILFVPTLLDYREIEEMADRVITFRQGLEKHPFRSKEAKNYIEDYSRRFAAKFLGTSDSEAIQKLRSNLRDYGDNTARYFRTTGYLHIRGGGYYIDLEPRRSVEINHLLSADNAAPIEFASSEEYVEYLSNLSEPKLPWEEASILLSIAKKAQAEVKELEKKLIAERIAFSQESIGSAETAKVSDLKEITARLRAYRQKLQRTLEAHESQSTTQIENYIDQLENIRDLPQPSLALEQLVTSGLVALNDAEEIRPNYPVGDDNQPTFTAPAKKPDIEGFYSRANIISEVTMLVTRDQWVNEGQPVMRHLRDFEEAHKNKQAYCIFIAPRVHVDTRETFWMAVTYGYKGTKQKIIPLTIGQFVGLLQFLRSLRKKGKSLAHENLFGLYDAILEETKAVKNSDEWLDAIPAVLEKWQKSLAK